jgi:hypothetical protein
MMLTNDRTAVIKELNTMFYSLLILKRKVRKNFFLFFV